MPEGLSYTPESERNTEQKKPQPDEIPKRPRPPGVLPAIAGRKDLKLAATLTAALALGEMSGCGPDGTSPAAEQPLKEKKSFSDCLPKTEATIFDGQPEFFESHLNGMFDESERNDRVKHYRNRGVTLFEDIGLTFYRVVKGDSKEKIIQKLLALDNERFGHLDEQKTKLTSFNIGNKHLRAGMWLPIPLENKDRQLSDEQFLKYADQAVKQLEDHPKYGSSVKKILDKAGHLGLLTAMLAVAKQESGGKPLGQFELHRWEPHVDAFSYSLFHVLMNFRYANGHRIEGPGLKARRNLQLTEGQLYHPNNAVKTYLAFIIEKSLEQRRNPEDFFPLNANRDKFAPFYNGGGWERINPQYLRDLIKYYGQALRLVADIADTDLNTAISSNDQILEIEETKYKARIKKFAEQAAAARVKKRNKKNKAIAVSNKSRQNIAGHNQRSAEYGYRNRGGRGKRHK